MWNCFLKQWKLQVKIASTASYISLNLAEIGSALIPLRLASAARHRDPERFHTSSGTDWYNSPQHLGQTGAIPRAVILSTLLNSEFTWDIIALK